MDRRSFLRGIIGAAVAPKLPTYFFAPIGGWKSDVIVNPLAVSVYEPLEILVDPTEDYWPLSAADTVLMLQTFNKKIDLLENVDDVLDKRFSDMGVAGDVVGRYIGIKRSSYPLTPTLKGRK